MAGLVLGSQVMVVKPPRSAARDAVAISSPYTNQRLFEMAARGMAVIVGCRSLPREYEFLCDVYSPDDLL